MVKDLPSNFRRAMTEWASFRLRGLWPDDNYGDLYHAMMERLLEDLASPRLHDEAMMDWRHDRFLLYIHGFGIDKEYVDNCLDDWCFTADREDLLSLIYDDMATQACKTCGVDKPLHMYTRQSSMKRGYKARCKACQAKAAAAYRERKRARNEGT